jgi:hypothetical protein
VNSAPSELSPVLAQKPLDLQAFVREDGLLIDLPARLGKDLTDKLQTTCPSSEHLAQLAA